MGLVAVVMTYEVVLATCNGQQFLDQQIASILQQTQPPARLLVSDDLSTDQTQQRLIVWQKNSSIPIDILPLEYSFRLGSCKNFERLLRTSTAPYVMMADQDDIWDLDKAERLLHRMQALELELGADIPLLVHADQRLIDSDGRHLSPSFHSCQGLYPDRDDVLSVGMQNIVAGCSSLLNRAVIDQALPFPADTVLHDWWLALVSAQAGGLAYVEDSCACYRQHQANVVGAKGWPRQLLTVLLGVMRRHPRVSAQRLITPPLLQLRACLSRFGPADLADAFELLWSRSSWVRLITAYKLGLRKHGLWRTAGFYAALICVRPSQHRVV